MRVMLSDKDRTKLFIGLRNKGLVTKQTAELIGVSPRTVSDWKRGKYTIPLRHFDALVKVAGVERIDLDPLIQKDWWQNSVAGKKGARIRIAKHGPLGTFESRRLGGNNSYALRKNKPGGIFTRKKIATPEHGELLAEFVGIMIGDGCVTKYQIAIYLSSLVDNDYAAFVVELIEKIFDTQPSIAKQRNANCLVITVSSIELVKFLRQNGVLLGNKIRQALDIPAWILEDKAYAIACLRGIFDTDGCIFQERHNIKQKCYRYPRLSFVSASSYLRDSIYEVLTDLDLKPKIRNNRSVNLESATDISTYFEVVGTSNPKHLQRWIRFGEVA